MYLTTRVPIHLSRPSLRKLWDVSHTCKDLWNTLNEEKKTNRLNYYDLKKIIPTLKSRDPKYIVPSFQVLQEVVKSLSGAWSSFFTKRKNGGIEVQPPGFKSYKYFFTQKYPQNGVSFEITGTTLKLAYGKRKRDWITVEMKAPKKSGYVLPDPTTIKTVTIFQDKQTHKFYASLTYETQAVTPVDRTVCPHTLYFDPGCKTALTGIKTDMTFWEYDLNPLRELNMKHYQLIDQLKSKRDKKTKGSRQ
ncbi:MAG: transposase, partial [Syntrophorhabdales bacterium]